MHFSFLAVVGVALGSLLLTGCVKEVPLVSKTSVTTNVTLEEQWAWMEEELDRSTAGSGVPDGWYKHFESQQVPWDADPANRKIIIKSLLPRGCGMGGQLVELLLNEDVSDPFGVAERMRTFWESEGWTVTDIYPEPNPDEVYFRADREDGAGLSFRASERGLALMVLTSCSVNNTVTHWEDYLGVPNTFQDELEIREQEDE